jgi:hypothetical protein
VSHVGELVQRARAQQRPRWSQQFLADELTRLGYTITREQIARFERSDPLRTNIELLAALAFVLKLDLQQLQAALFADYLAVANPLAQRFELAMQPAAEVSQLDPAIVPTRVPQLRALA